MLSRMKNRKGFTLIELMIVVAIIGILAAIAIPMYRAQQIKAKMTEGTRAVSTVASAIGDYYQDESEFPPACTTFQAVYNTLGVGISTGRYVSQIATDANGNITVTFQGIDADVNGNTLVLQPSTSTTTGAINWVWAGGAGMPEKYVPRE